MAYNYPLRFKSSYGGAIVEFDDLDSGTLIDSGTSPNISVGRHSTGWVIHTDDRWTPVAMPKAVRRKLHEMVATFKT